MIVTSQYGALSTQSRQKCEFENWPRVIAGAVHEPDAQLLQFFSAQAIIAKWEKFLSEIDRESDDLGPVDGLVPFSKALKTGRLSSTGANQQASGQSIVTFDRRELQLILNLYGRKVAEGEWRDYAIDFTAERAVFSIFRRTSEVPLFRIEKDPKSSRKQGAYSVVAFGGLIMKRGHELSRVVDVLDRKLKLVRS